MEDLIKEFRNFIIESNDSSVTGSNIFLEEVKKRLKDKVNELTDIMVNSPMMAVTTCFLKKETFVTHKSIMKSDFAGNNYSISVPMIMQKASSVALISVILVFPHSSGYMIQLEERFDNLDKPVNLMSYNVKKDYTSKDIDKVVEYITDSINSYRNKLK